MKQSDNVAIFPRPLYSDFFHSLATKLALPVRHEYSEFRKISQSPLVEKFYTHLDKQNTSSMSSDEVDDVIRRDRVLRHLCKETAVRYVHAMALAIDELITDTDPSLLLSVPVDNYIRDLFRKSTKRHGIPHIGFGDMFLRGYARIYHRSEHYPWRQVSDDEVKRVLRELLTDDYQVIPAVPPSLRGKYGVYSHLKRNIIYRIKKSLYKIRARAEHDIHNWEYLSVNWARDRKKVLGFLGVRYFDTNWRDKLMASTKPKVYIPLHVVPEGTIDYWVHNPFFLDYERRTLDLVCQLSKDTLVLVKEHPGMVGCRDTSFYKELKAFDNVVIVPPDAPSNLVIKEVDAILTWSGSVGLEAALRGKCVITVEKPYYVDGAPQWLPLKTEDDVANINQKLIKKCDELSSIDPTEYQFSMMRRVLESAIPAKFEEIGYKSEDNILAFAKALTPLVHNPEVLNAS